MMSIRLVAIDLDDTLLTDELEIPPGAVRAIEKARAAGVHVVIATGRMFPSARPFAEQLGLQTPLITYNGAMVKTAAEELLFHRPVPQDLALEVLDFAEDRQWPVQCYFHDRLYVPAITAGVIYYTELSGVPAQSTNHMRELVSESGPTKMLAIGSPEQTTERARALADFFGERLEVTISKPSFVEMMRPGISKGSALADVAALLGVAQDETMAIGDSFNDLHMLQWAGVGVAMGNGHPHIREIADHVVASNMDEGVAEAIERFVLA